MRTAPTLLALAFWLTTAACATDAGGTTGLAEPLDWLAPGQTSEAEVLQRLGQPAYRSESADGQRALLYFAYEIPIYGLGDWSQALEVRVRDGEVIEVRESGYLPERLGR